MLMFNKVITARVPREQAAVGYAGSFTRPPPEGCVGVV